MVKKLPVMQETQGAGNGYPLQYSCLENPMDRGAWRATVGGVTEPDITEVLTHTQNCWECVQSTGNSRCSINDMIIAVQSTFKLGFLVLLTFRHWTGEASEPLGIFLDSFPSPRSSPRAPCSSRHGR